MVVLADEVLQSVPVALSSGPWFIETHTISKGVLCKYTSRYSGAFLQNIRYRFVRNCALTYQIQHPVIEFSGFHWAPVFTGYFLV
jgi:hypothetical protein